MLIFAICLFSSILFAWRTSCSSELNTSQITYTRKPAAMHLNTSKANAQITSGARSIYLNSFQLEKFSAVVYLFATTGRLSSLLKSLMAGILERFLFSRVFPSNFFSTSASCFAFGNICEFYDNCSIDGAKESLLWYSDCMSTSFIGDSCFWIEGGLIVRNPFGTDGHSLLYTDAFDSRYSSSSSLTMVRF